MPDMNNRVGLNQLEAKVALRELGLESKDPEKKKQELELKKVEEQELAREKGEAVPEGKVTTSQFADISTTTGRQLVKVSTVVPFNPWPNTLVVDEVKVSVIDLKFFETEVVQTLLIKDITDVFVSKIPFFAAINISGGEYKPFPNGTAKTGQSLGMLQIKFLSHKDADLARRIILGLIIFNDRKVDTSKLEINDLRKQAEELGRARK